MHRFMSDGRAASKSGCCLVIVNWARVSRIRCSDSTTLEEQMSNHPNFDRAQAILDAIRKADCGPNFDLYSGDIPVENGPGAGPGKNSLAAGQTQA